jgi:hypothetical protein
LIGFCRRARAASAKHHDFVNSARYRAAVRRTPSITGTMRILRQATVSVREFAYAVVSCGVVIGALVLAHRLSMIG